MPSHRTTRRIRHRQKRQAGGGWGDWFKTLKSSFSWIPRMFTRKKKTSQPIYVLSPNNVKVDAPGHPQHGKTGAQIEREEEEKKYLKEKKQSNKELRSIFGMNNKTNRNMKSPHKSPHKTPRKSPHKSPHKSRKSSKSPNIVHV
jgi:hypothetical protein